MPLLLKLATTLPLVGIMAMMWDMFWSDMSIPIEKFSYFVFFFGMLFFIVYIWGYC